MAHYIDADKLTKAIEDKGLDCSFALKMERLDILAIIDELQQEQQNNEERVKHTADLLDSYQKGRKAGYEEVISELKEGKIECSPVIKELIDKLLEVGSAFNFGFGPKDFIQNQPDEINDDEKIMNFFDAIGDCGFSQHDILQLKNIWKEAGCPPPKSQVADSSKMEQEEVDLDIEREIENEWKKCYPTDEGMGLESANIVKEQFDAIAYRLIELGRNARKED